MQNTRMSDISRINSVESVSQKRRCTKYGLMIPVLVFRRSDHRQRRERERESVRVYVRKRTRRERESMIDGEKRRKYLWRRVVLSKLPRNTGHCIVKS